MKILNGKINQGLQHHEIRKVSFFLISNSNWKKIESSFSNSGRPAWMFKSGFCWWLSEKGKIERTTFRELMERGYSLKTEKRINRFSIWTITKDDMISRMERENEEAAELEDEMSRFWSGKIVKRIGPPRAFKLMNSIK